MSTQVPFQSGRHAAPGMAPMPQQHQYGAPHQYPSAAQYSSGPQYPAPNQYPYPPQAPAPAPASNGLATAGFVVALIGFVLSLIPIVGTVSWLLSPVGLVLSVVGLALAGRRRAGRGLAIAGAVLGVLGLLMCILYTAAFAAAVDGTTPTTGAAAVSAPASSGSAATSGATGAAGTVRYEATGSGRGAVTWTDGSGNMGQQTSARLPWTKDVKAADGFGFYSLSVSGGMDGGEVGCRIVKDGAVIAEQSAEGQFATASCSGS